MEGLEVSEALGHVPENQLWKYRRLRTIRDHLDIAAEMLLSSHSDKEVYRITSLAREFIQGEMNAMRVVVEREEVSESDEHSAG